MQAAGMDGGLDVGLQVMSGPQPAPRRGNPQNIKLRGVQGFDTVGPTAKHQLKYNLPRRRHGSGH